MTLPPQRAVLLYFIGLFCPASLSAQQRVGSTMEQLPPFQDSVVHRLLNGILIQMDAFNGDSSMVLIGQALGRVEQDQEALHYVLSYRAEVLYYEGLFNEAMRDLNRSEELALELKDSTLIANVYNLKGLLHENIQDSRLALPYLEKALNWFPKHPAARYPVSELHHIHGNIGSYLTTIGRLDSAAFHLRRSLELAKSAGAERAVAVAWWSLGNLAIARHEPDSALACFDRSWAEADRAKDHDIGVDALVGRSVAIAKTGDRAAAVEALQRAREYLKRNIAGIGLVTRRNFARQASAVSMEIDDANAALGFMADWHHIDSTITAKNIRTALATQAELINTDNALEMERVERRMVAETLAFERSNRMLQLGIGLLLIVAITVTALVNHARQRHKQRLAGSELVRLQQERTIGELRVREQVSRDLHDDLGVGLSALKLRSEMTLRTEQDPVKRQQMASLARTAGDLIGSMRQIIWTMDQDQSGLEDLVVYTTSYAKGYCEQNGIRIEVDAPGPWPTRELSTDQRRNIFLVVKEALHNTVKHAKAEQVNITIQWDNGLRLALQDDGIGLLPGADTGEGNGMRNMRKRVEALNGTMRLDGTSGTRIEVIVPLPASKVA